MSDPRVDRAIASGDAPAEIADILNDSQDTAALVTIMIFSVLAVFFVVCRLISRKYILKSYGIGLDDGLALVSLLVFIPFVGLCIELVNIGAGRSELFVAYILDRSGRTRLQIIDSVAHLIYSTALVLCRISGLAFYYRICSLHKEFLIAIKVIFATLILAYVAQMCLIIFHCQPVTLLWAPLDDYDVEFESHVCLWWFEIYSIISSISLVCDLLLFGIPAAMLKALELPGKQKLQLACTLLPGVLVIGISAGRIVLVFQYGFQYYTGFQFAFLKLLCIEVAEISATIIALSVPGVKPMVDKYILRKGKDSASSECSTPSENKSNERRMQKYTARELEDKLAE
ncbi:hypothetical protein VFPPC_06931 [Pochonia chlamydosporia 170]|uniref:Rhodopsin domain-containing protein n=1 Tax=Pochonia chlamydosporia 170 TaxID=1380566 RepID=A0A179FAF2_METCM|nr:hypothetical protein VFPPC_06931 [Pochonia chlamydosporia 170]OAQ62444.1 hypothetical protein VFPPC_06931 [Pochonia chlamydosporia 170]